MSCRCFSPSGFARTCEKTCGKSMPVQACLRGADSGLIVGLARTKARKIFARGAANTLQHPRGPPSSQIAPPAFPCEHPATIPLQQQSDFEIDSIAPIFR